MSISTEVQARFPSQTLIELTNPRTKGATSLSSTVLDQAITAAQAFFKTFVQAEYDSTIDQHVECICDCVIAILQRRGGATGGTARIRWDDWIEQARSLARVGPRGHEGPYSNSTLTPTTPTVEGGGAIRPEFDDAMFKDVIPLRSRSGDTGQGG